MKLFACKSCAEKDASAAALREAWKQASESREADITFLRETIAALTKKLTELHAPGITARTEVPKRRAPELVYPTVPKAAPLAGHHA